MINVTADIMAIIKGINIPIEIKADWLENKLQNETKQEIEKIEIYFIT